MRIVLNGKETLIKDDLSIQSLLEEMKIKPQLVACELNLKIVKRGEFPTIKISEGDRIEILQMIGGG